MWSPCADAGPWSTGLARPVTMTVSRRCTTRGRPGWPLAENSNRVQRLLLGSDVNLLEEVGKNHQDLGLVLNVPGGLNAQLDNLAAEGHAAGPDDAFLIDPLGNLMMVIPVELDPSLLLKDLKKLLKLSRVG